MGAARTLNVVETVEDLLAATATTENATAVIFESDGTLVVIVAEVALGIATPFARH